MPPQSDLRRLPDREISDLIKAVGENLIDDPALDPIRRDKTAAVHQKEILAGIGKRSEKLPVRAEQSAVDRKKIPI